MSRLVVDPITRVNGHLRIEAEVDGGVVRDAWASATSFRGLEPILAGRDPREAWLLAQRICGRCSGVHAIASVRAVEDALAVSIPANARAVRNLLLGSEFVLDHVAGFYQQHALDWADPAAALTADPAAAAVLSRSFDPDTRADAAALKVARGRLAAFAASGGSGALLGAGSTAPATAAPSELSLLLMAHQLEALDWQRSLVRFQTLLGGKSPHPQSFLVGGSALAVPWGGPAPAGPGQHPTQIDRRAPAALSVEGLAELSVIASQARAFVEHVYLPDVLALATAYPDAGRTGRGYANFLAFGEFPQDDSAEPDLLLPRGRILDGSLTRVEPVDQVRIGETTAHAWYADGGGDPATLRHPYSGVTDPQYTGPQPPYTTLAGSDRYSWIKAPRYGTMPMETGALARVLVAYAEGRPEVRDGVDAIVNRARLTPDALFSTLGRMLARAIEATVLVGQLELWIDAIRANIARGDLALVDLSRWDPSTWPSVARGVSLGEGPRGAVGHWITIRDGAVAEYQVVDGTTWNASPRDATGQRGPIEEALIGIVVADADQPIEVLRTVRGFDPCPACGVQ